MGPINWSKKKILKLIYLSCTLVVPIHFSQSKELVKKIYLFKDCSLVNNATAEFMP